MPHLVREFYQSKKKFLMQLFALRCWYKCRIFAVNNLNYAVLWKMQTSKLYRTRKNFFCSGLKTYLLIVFFFPAKVYVLLLHLQEQLVKLIIFVIHRHHSRIKPSNAFFFRQFEQQSSSTPKREDFQFKSTVTPDYLVFA